jgi:hypothetical protein
MSVPTTESFKTVATAPGTGAVAKTALTQVSNRVLQAVKASMVTYGTLESGGTQVAFLIGSTSGTKLRKVVLVYRPGKDTYEVYGMVCGLRMGEHGTELGQDVKVRYDDVYADQLADLVIAAAKATGARPKVWWK